MKKLSLLVAACFAMVTPALAQAPDEPIQNTPKYYYLGGDTKMVAFVADSVVVKGTHRFVWTMAFPHEPAVINSVSYDAMWVLSDFDCAASKMRVVRIEMEGDSGKIVQPGGETAYTGITVGTPGKTMEEIVCQSNFTAAKVVTLNEAAMFMAKYRLTDFSASPKA